MTLARSQGAVAFGCLGPVRGSGCGAFARGNLAREPPPTRKARMLPSRNMVTFTARQVRALRAGATAHFVCTLVLLFLSLPSWASHTNFPGHHHPEGTPDHVHGLQQVGLVSTAIPAAAADTLPMPSPAYSLPMAEEPRLATFLFQPASARAPPRRTPHGPTRPRSVRAAHRRTRHTLRSYTRHTLSLSRRPRTFGAHHTRIGATI